MSKNTIRLLIIFLVVLVGSGFLVYVLLERSAGRSVIERPAAPATQGVNPSSPAPAQTPPTAQPGNELLSELFGPDTATPVDPGLLASRIFFRFLVAALLAAFLAFRWRRNVAITKRNPYVAQTQILLAVVAAAMMMVVGDSAARAFGIFAAASLVRFRTNIRDPKEVTVLLVCLGVGLACGVGRMDMAAILTVFVFLALWILESFESSQVFRSMEVSVGSRNLDRTLKVLKDLFAHHELNSELRRLERTPEQNEVGQVVYQLNMGMDVSTDQLTEEILAADAENVASLEWDQKKSSTYIYR